MGGASGSAKTWLKREFVVNSSVAEISKEVIAQLAASGLINNPKQKRRRIDWRGFLFWSMCSIIIAKHRIGSVKEWGHCQTRATQHFTHVHDVGLMQSCATVTR